MARDRLDEARKLVRALAAHPQAIAADEEPTCHFCHCGYEYKRGRTVLLHRPDCLHLKAKSFLAATAPDSP